MSGDIGLSAEHSSRVNVIIINTVVMTMRLGCREMAKDVSLVAQNAS